jgi:hypothetical protein
MPDGRATLRRGGRPPVEHRVERLVLDADRSARRLGRLGRERGHGGNRLALEPDDLTREQRPVAHERAVADIRHVLLPQQGEHAGEEQLAVRHSGQREVGEVARSTGRLVERVLPRHTRADDAGQGATIRRSPRRVAA